MVVVVVVVVVGGGGGGAVAVNQVRANSTEGMPDSDCPSRRPCGGHVRRAPEI